MFPEMIHRVILYVLLTVGRDIGKTELDNILYLIDVESNRRTSEIMTKSTYIRKEWGPYSLELSNAIKEMKWYELKITTNTMEKSGFEKRTLRINNYPRFEPGLEKNDVDIIHYVLDEIRDLSPVQLKRKCFHTPPMEAIIKQELNDRLIDEELKF